MKFSNYASAATAALSLMMVPSFARGVPPPAPPPIADSAPIADELPSPKDTPVAAKAAVQTDPSPYQSNAGAINEGGGSANTNGMNNGTMPNSSGSGTNAALASDYSGFQFGGTGKKTSGEVKSDQSEDK